jgi:hypothetical protein
MSQLAQVFYHAVKAESKCLICGTSHDLNMHHVKPADKVSELRRIAINGDLKATIEELNKVVPLCQTHHLAVHKGIIGGWLDGKYESGSKAQAYKAKEFMPYLGYLAKIKPHLFTNFYSQYIDPCMAELVTYDRRKPVPSPSQWTIPLNFNENVITLKPNR